MPERQGTGVYCQLRSVGEIQFYRSGTIAYMQIDNVRMHTFEHQTGRRIGDDRESCPRKKKMALLPAGVSNP